MFSFVPSKGEAPVKAQWGHRTKGGGGILRDINGYSVPDVDFSASFFLVVDAPRMRDRLGILEFIVVLASRLCSLGVPHIKSGPVCCRYPSRKAELKDMVSLAQNLPGDKGQVGDGVCI